MLLLGNKADVKEVEVDPREVSALAIAAGFVYNFVSAAKNEGISESHHSRLQPPIPPKSPKKRRAARRDQSLPDITLLPGIT